MLLMIMISLGIESVLCHAIVYHSCNPDLLFEKQRIFLYNYKPLNKFGKFRKNWREVIDKCRFNNGVTDSRMRVVFHTLRHTWLACQN